MVYISLQNILNVQFKSFKSIIIIIFTYYILFSQKAALHHPDENSGAFLALPYLAVYYIPKPDGIHALYTKRFGRPDNTSSLYSGGPGLKYRPSDRLSQGFRGFSQSLEACSIHQISTRLLLSESYPAHYPPITFYLSILHIISVTASLNKPEMKQIWVFARSYHGHTPHNAKLSTRYISQYDRHSRILLS